jgi:hypothetical protein
MSGAKAWAAKWWWVISLSTGGWFAGTLGYLLTTPHPPTAAIVSDLAVAALSLGFGFGGLLNARVESGMWPSRT